LAIFLVLALTASAAASTQLTVNNQNLKIDVHITNGYYTDAQGDGLQNDVITEFTMNLTASTTVYDALQNASNSFAMTLQITEPSGLNFTYAYNQSLIFQLVTNTTALLSQSLSLHIKVYFWDHAIESGDYIFTVSISLAGSQNLNNSADLVFDPPGGTGGSPPTPTITTT